MRSSTAACRSAGQLLVHRARADLDALGLRVELACPSEQLDQGLAGAGHGVTRGDGGLRLDIDDEAIEVGTGLDAGGLDLVRHLGNRRVDRVDSDAADLRVRVVVLSSRNVAAATLDDELHLDGALLVELGDVQLGVEHLDTGRSGDVGGGHCARTRLAQVHGDGLVIVAGQHQPLEVEDDLGDILDHPGQGAGTRAGCPRF